MRVSSTQRWVSVGLLLLFAFLSIEAANHRRWGWYLVAVVLLALAWLISQLPSHSSSADVSPGAMARYVVQVAFVGPAPLVFDRLIGQGFKVSGSGICTDADREALATLEVTGTSAAFVRTTAERAIRDAGAAKITQVGHPWVLS